VSTYLIFNKPYQVLTQFTDAQGRQTLADYISVPDVYSAGRLDFDSEGLLILTDDGQLIHSMMHPKFKTPKTYLAQVEGIPSIEKLALFESGLLLKDGKTAPSKIKIVDQPEWLWERQPPIRERKTIPTTWLSITLTEGKNRQVRRMTAAIGHPTLRLIRSQIGFLSVDQIGLGEFKQVELNSLTDNGINLLAKKGSSSAASQRTKRLGRHQPRNQRSRNRNRTNGKTRPDNH
jgi:23S rRNA pseudouridine2457 synthase